MLPLFATSRIDALILNAAGVIWIMPELVSSFTRRPGPDTRVNDRFSGAILIACLWFGVSAAYSFAYAAPQLAIPRHRTLLFSAGIMLMLAGVAFRWYSVRVLGRYFTCVIAIQPGQTVIEKGPYRYIRHPSYSGALLTILGLALAFANWLSLAAVMLFAAIGYSYRIWVEEQTLLEALGDSYQGYMKRTRRIIPFLI